MRRWLRMTGKLKGMLKTLNFGRLAAHPRILPVAPVLLTAALMLSLWLRSLSPLEPDSSSTALYDPATQSVAASAIELHELAWRTGLPASQFRLAYKHQPQVTLPDDPPIEDRKEALLKLVVLPSGQIIRVEVVNSTGQPPLDAALLQGYTHAAFQPFQLPGNPAAVITYQSFAIDPADTPKPEPENNIETKAEASPEPLLATQDINPLKPR